MELDFHSFDASIWLCSPPIIKNRKDSQTEPNTLEKTGLQNEELNINCDESMKLSPLQSCTEEEKTTNERSAPVSNMDLDATSMVSNDNVVVSWYKRQLLKFRNVQVNCTTSTSF